MWGRHIYPYYYLGLCVVDINAMQCREAGYSLFMAIDSSCIPKHSVDSPRGIIFAEVNSYTVI